MTGYTFFQMGFQPEPRVGSYIALDGWDEPHGKPHWSGECLEACTDWEQAAFRLPCTSLHIPCAVNVEVTGRTVQFDSDRNQWVRVAVTFVGDCEPDQVHRGWMLVN